MQNDKKSLILAICSIVLCVGGGNLYANMPILGTIDLLGNQLTSFQAKDSVGTVLKSNKDVIVIQNALNNNKDGQISVAITNDAKNFYLNVYNDANCQSLIASFTNNNPYFTTIVYQDSSGGNGSIDLSQLNDMNNKKGIINVKIKRLVSQVLSSTIKNCLVYDIYMVNKPSTMRVVSADKTRDVMINFDKINPENSVFQFNRSKTCTEISSNQLFYYTDLIKDSMLIDNISVTLPKLPTTWDAASPVIYVRVHFGINPLPKTPGLLPTIPGIPSVDNSGTAQATINLNGNKLNKFDVSVDGGKNYFPDVPNAFSYIGSNLYCCINDNQKKLISSGMTGNEKLSFEINGAFILKDVTPNISTFGDCYKVTIK